MVIFFVGCDFGIVTSISIGYDKRRRPQSDVPRGGSVTKKIKKIPAPPYLKEALRREVIMPCLNDFHR
jgi:hypothetical protein